MVHVQPNLEILEPKGFAVLVEAQHQCMSCRGVRKNGGTMITSAFVGAFQENPASRAEFLTLVKG